MASCLFQVITVGRILSKLDRTTRYDTLVVRQDKWRAHVSGNKQAFTVVELLIVIVVIGILATLTIIAYSGVQNQAKTAAVQSDISSVARKLAEYRVKNNSTYPANLAAINIADNANTDYSYSTIITNNVSYYCLQGKNGAIIYHVSSEEALTAGSCVPTSGLTHAWYLDGSTLASVGSVDGTGTALTTTTNQLGETNKAYNFNGTSSYISLPSNVPINTSEGSISLWFNASTIGTDRFLFGAGTAGLDGANGAAGGLFMYLQGSTGYLRAGWADGTSDIDAGVSNGAVATGAWKNAILSWSSSGNFVRLYIDGTLQPASDVFTGNGKTGWQSVMSIGSAFGSKYFSGSIDNVLAYNRALEVYEAKYIFDAGP